MIVHPESTRAARPEARYPLPADGTLTAAERAGDAERAHGRQPSEARANGPAGARTPEAALRVLIVEPALQAAIQLGEMLDGQPDLTVVGVATTGQDAMRAAAELHPDVVVMEIDLPDVDGIQTAWLLGSKYPDCTVIILTAEHRPEYVQRAKVTGAQGYLLKPVHDPHEITDAIHTARLHAVGAPAHPGSAGLPTIPTASGPQPLGRRLALFSPKGGQGKTSIAVNLAVMLQRTTGKSVALVDADLRFGDANILLDLPFGRSLVDLLPHMEQLDAELLKQVLIRHSSGLHLLARPERAELAETITAAHMERVLTILPQMFEYSVFDCEVSYDEKLLAILDHADSILLVLTPNLGALRNAKHFLQLAEGLGYPRGKIDFVLNRANSSVNVSAADVERALGPGRYFRVGSYGRLLTNDLNNGVPTTLAHPRAEFTQAIGGIAQHVSRPDQGRR
jgi:pilus assembly protein CpaE